MAPFAICSRVVPATVLLGLLAACSTTPRCDPDERLDVYLEAYEDARASGTGAYADLSGNHVVEDCGRIAQRLEQLSMRFPGHGPTLMANAIIRYDAAEPERAQYYLDQLYRIEPRNPDAAILSAKISLEEGNRPFARRRLEEQVRLSPDHPGLRELLASVYFLAADYEKAKKQLEQAERLGAPAWRIAYNLGLVHEHGGDRDAAKAEYRRAIEANPEAKDAKSRLRALEAEVDTQYIVPWEPDVHSAIALDPRRRFCQPRCLTKRRSPP